jgi:mRNA interferase RelE/StbE
MAWTVEFERAAERELGNLGRPEAQRILLFLSRRLAVLEDPRSLGQPLRGSTLGGLWKYRVGDYRIIAAIEDAAVRILVVRVGHRREVYR